MAILHKLVFLTACPGTHHKLAMDALRHLRCPEADRWHDLFLNYYEPYLEGAKAPDKEFKDFQNHVLHVRENYWGGAIRTAQLWYERLVKALRREYWSDAVYTAGVLSHYFTDPMMPFHTGQTEEEGRVHRAAEWSITKCYEEFQKILEQDFGGYPTVLTPEGPDWLSKLIKEGAELANSHYQPLLDHYNLAAGVQHPPSGLDQEAKDRVAQMIGFAAVGFARVLEKAFVEAGSAPPMCELVTETVLATLKAPGRWLLARMDDEDEREELEELLAEVEQTGKALETLRDDDRFVRKLHAHQVLKVSLKDLDAQPAKPTGLHYGTGKLDRRRAPDFFERWFGWDLNWLDWEDDDAPQFVPPIPVPRQGVGMSTPGVSRVVGPAAMHSAGTASGEVRSGTVRSGAGGAATSRRRRRGASRPSVPWRESAAGEFREKLSAEQSQESPSANGDATAWEASRRAPAKAIAVEGDDRGERISAAPPPKRSWLNWTRRKDAAQPASAETTDDVERKSAVASSEESHSEASNGAGDRDVARAESRGVRFKQAMRGVASKVWQGTTNAAGKMKKFVPKFKRGSKPAETAESLAEEAGDSAAERQGLASRSMEEPMQGGKGRSSSRSKELKFYLQLDSAVEDAPSIGPKMARRLEGQGVRSIADLLETDADELAERLGQKQIDGDVVRQWQQQSDLMCRIPEVRGHDVQILVACGITDPAELAAMDPASLYELVEPFLGTREAESILRGSPAPDLNEIADWIDWAQHARPRRAA